MQALEILAMGLHDGQHFALRSKHADSFIVGWPVGAKPEEVTARAMQ
jgi:hypothetical protein